MTMHTERAIALLKVIKKEQHSVDNSRTQAIDEALSDLKKLEKELPKLSSGVERKEVLLILGRWLFSFPVLKALIDVFLDSGG